MTGRTIVTIKFGSHLYGTSTPQSDLDFKGVYVPPLLTAGAPELQSIARRIVEP